MFEGIQIGAKLVIITAIFLVAGFAALKVWRADLDLRELLNPSRAVGESVKSAIDWLPTRDPNALYQDGRIVGMVEGVLVDEAKSQVTFTTVRRALAFDTAKEFQFQKWRLKYRRSDSEAKIEGLAVQAERGFSNMMCEITGKRSL